MASDDLRSGDERRHIESRLPFGSDLPIDPYLYPILALALALRLPRINRSFWLDEAYSVMVRGAADPITAMTMEGPHPPLYFLTLHYWMELFGNSEVAVRLLSVLFGLGSVVAIYLLGRRLYDRRTGLLSAALLSVSTLSVQLSQTARMYSALLMFALLATYFYARLLDADTFGNRAGYVATGVLLVMTHVYGWFVVLAHAIHLAVHYLRERTHADAVRAAKMQALVGLGALPWLALILIPSYLLENNEDTSWIPVPDRQVVVDLVLSYGGVPTNYPIIAKGELVTTAGYAFVAVCALAVAFLAAQEVREEGTISRGTTLLLSFVVATTVVPYLVSLTVFPILIVRYGFLGFLGVAVLLAAGVARVRWSTARIACAVVVVMLLLPGLATYYQTPTSEDWTGLGETISGDDDLSNDLILYDPGYTEPPTAYYLSERSKQEATTVRAGYLFEVESEIRSGSYDQIWIPTYGDTSEYVTDNVTRQYRRAESYDFGAMTLYRYDRAGTGGSAADGSQNGSAAVRDPTAPPAPADRRDPTPTADPPVRGAV